MLFRAFVNSKYGRGVAILPDNMNTPLLHVLIINWNGRDHLEACFDSLLASTYGNARYILVDNASEDDSVAFVEENYGSDERVEILVCPENLGWSGGNNYAMKASIAAGADFIFLLNNDTACAPDTMDTVVAMAEEHPEIGALAPKMVLFDHPQILNSVGLECSIIGGAWDQGIGRLDGPHWSRSESVAGVCGGACLLRTDALKKTGLLPEGFDIYLDDLDLCLRIWDAGYEIRSCPEAVVRHKFSATYGEGAAARRKYFLNTRNRFWVILRNFPLVHFPKIGAMVCVGEARAMGRALLDGNYWRIGVHLQAWCAGLAYLPKALAERRRRRRSGLNLGSFWRFVLTTPLFSPGVELPDRGWYSEREVNGLSVCPISAEASVDVSGGQYRCVAVNPYPALATSEVEIWMGDTCLAVMSTDKQTEATVEVEDGELIFRSKQIFDATQTGELSDYGGWVSFSDIS
jgi:GT2 family glycosyltransferase